MSNHNKPYLNWKRIYSGDVYISLQTGFVVQGHKYVNI